MKGRLIILSIVTILFTTAFNLIDGPEENTLKKLESSFQRYVSELYYALDDPTLKEDALEQGLEGYFHLKANSEIKDDAKLIIFDLNQASTAQRLYIIDVNRTILDCFSPPYLVKFKFCQAFPCSSLIGCP